MYLDGHTIANEMEMAKYYESGTMMQSPESVRYIVIHCTGTKVTNDYTVDHLMRDHLDRGFRTIGYHFYIRRDGTTTQHRKLFANAMVVGHRDLLGATPKLCPCFDATREYKER